MAGASDKLIERILEAAQDQAAAERVARLIAEATAEAEAETRALLRSAIKAALLREAAAQLQQPASAFQPEPVTKPQEALRPPPAVPSPPTADKSSARDSTLAEKSFNRPPGGEEFGWYVYGIAPANHAREFPVAPTVDPRFPLQSIRCRELEAITSRVALDEFASPESSEGPGDLAWIEHKARIHDQVLRSILACGAVVPFRFCTVFRSEEDVRSVLADHHDRLVDALAALEGRREWGVKILAAKSAGRHGERPEGADLAESSASEPSGTAYLRRKRQNALSRGESRRNLRSSAERLHEQLATVATDALVLPPPRLAAAEAGSQAPLLNAAYLVSEEDDDRFHERIRELSDRGAASGLRVHLTGPWPPYNFVHLDLTPENAR